MQGIADATERHRHAERQLGAMQASIEQLILTKADKGDIATATKLKAGLAHIQQKAADAVRVQFCSCWVFAWHKNQISSELGSQYQRSCSLGF